ncbi:MAG: hypothetical protein ACRDH9_07285 [Actinomycetota bacterium]
MIRTRPRMWPAAILAIAATLPLASPASATHAGIHPTFRPETTYFACAQKVNNLNAVQGAYPSWSTTAPTQSFQAGAGCGHLDVLVYGTQPATPYDLVYNGTFTGNIQNMKFELHNLLLSQVRVAGTFSVGLRVSIDGEHLFGDGTTQGLEIALTPELSSTGLTEKMTFSIQKIGCAKEIKDASGNVIDVKTDGFATEDGDGEEEHSIQVTIDQFYLDQAAAWVWGATEIPGGITFNSPTLAPTKVSPEDAATC